MAAATDVKLAGWSSQQVERAVASLQKFVGSKQAASTSLLDDEDEVFYMQLALKKMPMRERKDKPIALPLPHPFVSAEGAEICLFVKDHAGEGHKSAKLMLAKLEKKGGVTKVIGLSKLRTKYESFESKRELCKLYDLFLADERVLPSLPKLIGKSFFKKKKQPIPIKVTAADFPAQVQKACSATYMFSHAGTCINIKVALSSQSTAHIVENIHAVLVKAVEHVPKKWSNVQAVFLKTADSVALPLFQCLPDPAARIRVNPPPSTTPSHSAGPEAARPSAAASQTAPSRVAQPAKHLETVEPTLRPQPADPATQGAQGRSAGKGSGSFSTSGKPASGTKRPAIPAVEASRGATAGRVSKAAGSKRAGKLDTAAKLNVTAQKAPAAPKGVSKKQKHK
ncbi:ribosomal protein L1p/L10e family-domain-containing protein [Haematococcus lacustris]